MKFQKLKIDGLIVVEPLVHGDERGFFLERYIKRVFSENGVNSDFVQDNHSQSTRGVLRGLHFQAPPHAQDKLVWVVSGEVFDVAVDLRLGSPTFGQGEAVTLSAENKKMFFIPQGFAHGFQVVSETADVLYKISDYYFPELDMGIRWDDPDLGIKWPLPNPIVSAKDQKIFLLKDFKSPFTF
ncbi:MAG: dTDP-4-dehydrorhamnose 3,5-epimerase [Candidatus Komeilibacteria bacterium RIFCSPLOWO2_02_FULL_48_11]|uniref:dTDP-4-dehydrorhamnose 3,5-epimerase n=1 Tax=Candidatus Komeilibacteria bacterium RIFCSPLOWO2_02_FULL_48_11 TaxID=1798553 RepID=A0A1G2BVB5_9BACT|nr:MAG: dTDP-4-dehydrorhamnose 3,5-epimerase [Candidatus Komeilibacteria bacterium RIFCSPLOWO2_02_FULL_48_11]